jgi:pilus assembly protein Flp/PilA
VPSRKKCVLEFLREEEGPTSIEYAIMLVVVIVVCIAAITLIGQTTADNFSATPLSSAMDVTGS